MATDGSVANRPATNALNSVPRKNTERSCTNPLPGLYRTKPRHVPAARSRSLDCFSLHHGGSHVNCQRPSLSRPLEFVLHLATVGSALFALTERSGPKKFPFSRESGCPKRLRGVVRPTSNVAQPHWPSGSRSQAEDTSPRDQCAHWRRVRRTDSPPTMARPIALTTLPEETRQ